VVRLGRARVNFTRCTTPDKDRCYRRKARDIFDGAHRQYRRCCAPHEATTRQVFCPGDGNAPRNVIRERRIIQEDVMRPRADRLDADVSLDADASRAEATAP